MDDPKKDTPQQDAQEAQGEQPPNPDSIFPMPNMDRELREGQAAEEKRHDDE